MNKEIGQRIKKLRENKNLTQNELANLLGYSNNSVISKIENGDIEISIHITEQLKGIFNVSTDYLYFGTNDVNTKSNSETITKSINVITNFNRINLIHVIYLLTMFLLLVLTIFLKNKTQQGFLLFNSLVAISFIVVNIITKKNDLTKHVVTYHMPEDKKVVYKNSLTDTITKRYKKDKILIFILMIILDIFFYGIILTQINSYEESILLPAILIVTVLALIITKIIYMIIPIRGEIVNYSKNLFIVLSLQIVLTCLSLLMLTIINIEGFKEVLIFGVFNLIVFIFAILANNYIMSKYYFAIEN